MTVLDEPEFGAVMLVLMALIETHPDKAAFAAKLREATAIIQAGMAASGEPVNSQGLRDAVTRYLAASGD